MTNKEFEEWVLIEYLRYTKFQSGPLSNRKHKQFKIRFLKAIKKHTSLNKTEALKEWEKFNTKMLPSKLPTHAKRWDGL